MTHILEDLTHKMESQPPEKVFCPSFVSFSVFFWLFWKIEGHLESQF